MYIMMYKRYLHAMGGFVKQLLFWFFCLLCMAFGFVIVVSEPKPSINGYAPLLVMLTSLICAMEWNFGGSASFFCHVCWLLFSVKHNYCEQAKIVMFWLHIEQFSSTNLWRGISQEDWRQLNFSTLDSLRDFREVACKRACKALYFRGKVCWRIS